MSEINLSSAVRTSLTSLQQTADLLSSTQERLATGNRVNSALDDPTAFFTAAALNDRASDLGTLLDQQQSAIRTVEVADDAISAISDLVDSARAQATAALQSEDATVRANAAAAFDEIVSQIEALAGDASFNGTNLLEGDDLQVVFNEENTASLTVEGVDFTDAGTGLGFNTQSGTQTGNVDASVALADIGTLAAGEITISDGTDSITLNVTDSDGTPGIAAADVQAAFDAIPAADRGGISFDGTDITSNAGNLTITNGADVTTSAADGTAFSVGTGGNFDTDAQINAALSSVDDALSTLRSSAASLGSDLSTIQIRQDFTSNLINTLESGAGDLTLADLNEEGANVLTLQTRQSLASTSLSFATQSDSSVLQLFS